MAMSTEQLAARFADALKNDISILKEICAPDCRLWHSSDNIWMDQRPALEAFMKAQEGGAIPKFDQVDIIPTAKGFLAQASMTMPPIGKMHLVQLMTVENGLITVIEEYIAPEMDIAAQLAAA